MQEADHLARHLWAKTDRDHPDRWHPLITHLIDVASVALEMWDTTLPSTSRGAWTDWFGGDRDAAGRWLALLAGLHDLGKASPVFQGASDAQRARLIAAGVRLRPREPHPLRHGTITAATLPQLLRARWPHLAPAVARRYAVLSGMHHGSLIDWTSLRNASPRRNPEQTGVGEWEDARRALLDRLVDTIDGVTDPPEARLPYALATWAAGFISVADWIGSNTAHFPFAPPDGDLTNATAIARDRARMALDDLGWLSGTVDVPTGFNRAFRGWQPNTTQIATMDAVGEMDGAGLIILEAPMGEGKTEAAFWAAAWAQEHWGTRGLYVAMPTRATSDQLFTRLRDHLAAHAADHQKLNLQLLHGHAAISAQLEQVRRASPFDSQPAASSPDQPDDALLRADWFSARRRGLLAPYGVGTVDQTLLGVLENRHYFVRLHGLAGKTLVFDEVHAYDTYMETLFARELEALGALGTSVVILSATLPRERRDTLSRAYAAGAGWDTASGDPVRYPRVTAVDQHGVHETGIAPSGRDRTVSLRWFTGAEAAARTSMLNALDEVLADNDGTCAVICNTVGQAQEMYGLLDARFPGEVELFHARFRYLERAERQGRVLGAFGKQRQLTGKRIVVATQVIEQSLDLDFDLMVTYFCPTDLLIQRLGRMHRHAANDPRRPPDLRTPQLWVLGVGDARDGEYPKLGVPYVTRLVYEPHALLRSWAVLRDRDRLVLPADIEPCVEATYATDMVPPLDLVEEWHRSEQAMRENMASDTREANRMLIPSLAEGGIADGADPLIRNVSEKLAEDDQTQDLAASALARTRLGPPTLDVVLLTTDEQERLEPPSWDHGGPLALPAVAELLARSVSLTQPGIVRELLTRDPPPAWQRTGWLQRHRLLCLDATRRASVGRYTIELSPVLGVVVHRGGDPEED